MTRHGGDRDRGRSGLERVGELAVAALVHRLVGAVAELEDQMARSVRDAGDGERGRLALTSELLALLALRNLDAVPGGIGHLRLERGERCCGEQAEPGQEQDRAEYQCLWR